MTSAAPKPLQGAAGAGEDVEETPQIRALRLAVIGMGLLLVIGFITVIARIVYLATRTAPPSVAGQAGVLAAEGRLELPAGAVVRSTSLAGTRLAVSYTSAAGDGIAIVDLETGKVVSRIKIESAR